MGDIIRNKRTKHSFVVLKSKTNKVDVAPFYQEIPNPKNHFDKMIGEWEFMFIAKFENK